MSGILDAILAAAGASLDFPTGWGNISGVHTGTSNSSSPNSGAGTWPGSLPLVTITWSDPGHSFAVNWGQSGASHAVTSGVAFAMEDRTSGPYNEFIRADSASAVGPVTLTISATGYNNKTITATLT